MKLRASAFIQQVRQNDDAAYFGLHFSHVPGRLQGNETHDTRSRPPFVRRVRLAVRKFQSRATIARTTANDTPKALRGQVKTCGRGRSTAPFLSYVEKVEEPVGGVELEEVFPLGLTDGQEHADRRSAHQEHLRGKAARLSTTQHTSTQHMGGCNLGELCRRSCTNKHKAIDHVVTKEVGS